MGEGPLRKSIALLALLGMAAPLRAQSISAGSVMGRVNDTTGAAVGNARVVLVDRGTGSRSVIETGRDGQYAFLYLPPGSYDLFAEQFGFRPLRVAGIPIAPATTTHVDVSLTPMLPPIDSVEVRPFEAVGIAAGFPGTKWRFGALELRDLPDESRDVSQLVDETSLDGRGFALEGLPDRYSSLAVDGVPFAGARNPGFRRSLWAAAPFTLSAFESAQLLGGGLDVEWSGLPGAELSLQSRRGTREWTARGYADCGA